MIYTAAKRYDIARVQCVRITSYMSTWRGDQVMLHRHAFQQEHSKLKFVYTGKCLPVTEGRFYDLRATVKREMDKYGFIRLSRPQIITIRQKELFL